MLFCVTLLQREALEAGPVAERAQSQVEAVVCTTLTARSEPYNRRAIHAEPAAVISSVLIGHDFAPVLRGVEPH